MIPKREILDIATQTNLQPLVVEKDYVLGWLLAGINQHPALSESWVFKGGTCLKKCYFETYRFSEDLDFTLRDASHINEVFLQETFRQIATWVYENSGIEIAADRTTFEIYQNPRGIESCQGRLYYRGPVTATVGKHSIPRIKLDLTVDEVLVDKPNLTAVRHGYSDFPSTDIHILSYSYTEVFAEKIRALKERTRPRDLYDVINFFRRPESLELAASVQEILKKKCEYKNISFPLQSDLEDHKDSCEAGWKDQLAHQLPALPPFSSFWNELNAFFEWLENPDKITLPQAVISSKEGEVQASLWRKGTGEPQTSMLDLIRFAAVSRLCVELDYRKESGTRQIYLIEPYSLRATADNNLILYGVKLPAAQIRGFRTDRILGATVTGNAFVPRFSVDFIPDVPILQNIKRSTTQSQSLTESALSPSILLNQRTRTKSHGSLQYVFKCAVCNKQFTKSSNTSRLNPHKNKHGTPCYGRTGYFVKTTR